MEDRIVPIRKPVACNQHHPINLKNILTKSISWRNISNFVLFLIKVLYLQVFFLLLELASTKGIVKGRFYVGLFSFQGIITFITLENLAVRFVVCFLYLPFWWEKRLSRALLSGIPSRAWGRQSRRRPVWDKPGTSSASAWTSSFHRKCQSLCAEKCRNIMTSVFFRIIVQ